MFTIQSIISVIVGIAACKFYGVINFFTLLSIFAVQKGDNLKDSVAASTVRERPIILA